MPAIANMTWERKLGRLIVEWRRQRGWTQTDLAIFLGVSQPTVSNYERGHLGGDIRLGKALAARLELHACVLGAWILEDLVGVGAT